MAVQREIRTRQEPVSCAVCGRTLLAGERPDTYLSGGARRQVCELCIGRALHHGWVRESAEVELSGNRPRRDDRRPFFERLRSRRERTGNRERGGEQADPAAGEQDYDELAPLEERHPVFASPAPAAQPAWDAAAEPRHVHAVPASGEMKAAQALTCFNASAHPRTIAGVAKSLGVPNVSVRTHATELSVVTIVVAWELCWYRYEVDLAEEGDPVRQVAQGYELSELDPEEQAANAAADERGVLELLGA